MHGVIPYKIPPHSASLHLKKFVDDLRKPAAQWIYGSGLRLMETLREPSYQAQSRVLLAKDGETT
jgi:hypothetical protein